MEYVKIFEAKNKRFYRFSEYLYEGKFGLIVPTKYVVISDSNMYTERLVFAIYFKEGCGEESFYKDLKHFLYVDRVHIEGSMTSISNNPIVFPDEYYLNKLVMKNY